MSRLPQSWFLRVGFCCIVIVGAFAAYGLVAHGGTPLGHRNANGELGTYWSMPETLFPGPRTVTTDARTFHIGDAVTMPNGLRLQATRVERDWQPSTAQATFGRTPSGDNPAGRETVLVWFTATDVGQSPIAYNNLFFSLKRAGQPELRMAVLSVLPPTDYGSKGKSPWLFPGEQMNTFVPFLVNPDETLESFQYYYYGPDSPTHRTIDRLSVELRSGQSDSYTFSGTESITVK